MIVALLVQVALGLALMALGHWGRTHAGDLPAITAAPDERGRLTGVYHRGGTACIVVGVLLVLAATVPAIVA